MGAELHSRQTNQNIRATKGAIEAVAGPEAANNASAAGVLAPLLSLGLPTSATAAILLAAFQQYGIQPGPLLFGRNPELVWGLIASLYIGNVLLLALNPAACRRVGEVAPHPEAAPLLRYSSRCEWCSRVRVLSWRYPKSRSSIPLTRPWLIISLSNPPATAASWSMIKKLCVFSW
jgi:hypothetical protein